MDIAIIEHKMHRECFAHHLDFHNWGVYFVDWEVPNRYVY